MQHSIRYAVQRRIPVCIFTIVSLAGSLVACADESSAIDFTSQIRPLLSDKCFQCHGPAEEDREADLRLDIKESAFAEVSEGKAIVPGKPHDSVIYQRITSDDEDQIMPPADAGKKLTDQERDLIRKWIEQGASWSEHWAFVPPKRPDVPKVQDDGFVQNPIDAFVLHRLEENGLRPAKKADRAKLLRRLHLDLTGLLPTVREIDQFLNDISDDAYKNKVEELLRSPHYGEKWARHWLDAARYSDSDGFEKDKPGSGLMYAMGVTKSRDANVASKQQFGDVELQAEFLIPSGSNSGIYFMGRYEVQIKDSFGKTEIDSHDCGAIYQRWDDKRPKGQQGYEGHVPESNACTLPGQWQSFHIVFRAPRFDANGTKIADAVFKQVKHNGVVIHSDVSLTGPTRGGLSETESAVGPFLLQGNHGPIAFRKFLVRETTE